MDSEKSRGGWLPLIVTIVALIGLCGMALLFAAGRVPRTIPASEGMPQVPPGQVLVQAPAPTAAPALVPTREVAPPAEAIPTPQPINPPPLTGNEAIDTGGVEPQPVNPGDASATANNGTQPQPNENLPPSSGIDESVQPFPAGSNPPSASSSSASSGSSGTRCGRRVVHVVQPGENIFRISLRYDTTINAIVIRNGIDDVRAVRPGTRLVVVTCEQR